MNSPWGQIDRVEKLIRGVAFVSTPGHGGIRVSKGVADARLSLEAREEAIYQNDYYWFEEDCQYAIPLFELADARAAFYAWQDKGVSDEDRVARLTKSLAFWERVYCLKHGIQIEDPTFACSNFQSHRPEKPAGERGHVVIVTRDDGSQYAVCRCGRRLADNVGEPING